MERAKQSGLTFNSKKCFIQQESVSFFGVVFGKDGMSPDPKKIQGILEIPPPKDTITVFLSHGQLHAQPYSSLITTHSNIEKSTQQECSFPLGWVNNATFQKLKSLIAEAQKRSLKFYNRNLPLTVQADASKHGLGAALLQQGQPVAFAYKCLSDTEKRYANIERELLSVVFACECFQTYLLGREFSMESDHKPLEMIALKILVAAPPRLKRMLLRLQPFDCNIKYKPRKEMLLFIQITKSSQHNH